MKRISKLLFGVIISVVVLSCLSIASFAADSKWIGAWSTAVTNVSLEDYPNITFEGKDLTARVVLTPTASGDRIRFHFSNLYGTSDIKICMAYVADSTCESTDVSKVTSGIDTDSNTPITYNHTSTFTIPAGKEIVSDTVYFPVTAQKNIAVSIYLENSAEIKTMGLSGASTYITTGNGVTNENFNFLNLFDDNGIKDYIEILQNISSVSKLFDVSLSYSLVRVVPVLSGMDVYASGDAYTVDVIGDSTVANQFPLYLSQRIAETGTTNVGVLGKGIIGNTLNIAKDTTLGSLIYGEPTITRFSRDVKDQANVKYVILKIGANDIMHPVCTDSTGVKQPTAADIIANMKNVCNQAHEMGAKIIVSTITQWKGTTRDYFGTGGTYVRSEEEFEEDWKIAKTVNKWILSSTNTYVDYAVDLCKVSASKTDSAAFDPEYTSDYIHPNDTLQKIWAESIPLSAIGVSNKVASIKLNKSAAALDIGEKVALKVTKILPEDAANKSYTWYSSNTNVAVVSTAGKVTAVGNGTAYIVCKASDGSGTKGKCKITVTTPVDSVSLDQKSVVAYTRDLLTLKATVLPYDASNQKVTWTSSNTSVATVSSKGVVSCVKSGSTVITVTTKDGSFEATCKVKVKSRIDVTMISAPKTKNMYVGKTATFNATVLPTDATYPQLKWWSSDKTIATVDQTGKVTAIKTGTCYIKVKSIDNPSVYVKITLKVWKHVSGVKLVPENSVVVIGSTGKQLTTTVSPSTAYNKNVTYKSSDKSIAKVTSTGLVKGVAPGVCTVTVTTEDGSYKDTVNIQVIKQVFSKKITLNRSTGTTHVGNTFTLKPTFEPENTTNKSVSWTTSNSKVATVSSKGVVKGISKGTAVITCVTRDSGKTATCKVTVKNVSVTKVTLSYSSYSLKVGQSTTLRATLTPSNATVKTKKWSSSNTSVATVSSNGTVKAKSPGTATISCTSGSKTAKCKITVKKIAVTSVKLSASSLSLNYGNKKTLKATISPSNASYKSVKWTSSDTSVATVSSKGVVKGVGKGTATITCKATDGSGKKATCKVTVNAIKVIGVTMNATNLVMDKGKTFQLSATCHPTDASNKSLQWVSTNRAVATVDAYGKVTAVGSGTCAIKAISVDSEALASCSVKVN